MSDMCGTLFACSECDYTCKHMITFKYHQRIHESMKSPSVCLNIFSKLSSSNHNLLPSCAKPLSTFDCMHQCSVLSNLRLHKPAPSNERVSCTQCVVSCKNVISSKYHIRIHTNEMPCISPECAYKGSTLESLHNLPSMSLSCTDCKYKCKSFEDMKLHRVSHSILNQFSCTKCEYKCKTARELKRHRRKTHPKEKPFSCNQCNYKTKYFGDLKRHKLIHSKEKPFKCTECEYRCKEPYKLKHHQLSHSDEKNFMCTECEFKCKRLFQLERHKLIHSIEKPFMCMKCGYKCKRLSDLKRHNLSHSNLKPFSCNKCGYRCKESYRLKTHNNIHSDMRPFSCSNCEYECRHSTSLKHHLLTHTVKQAGSESSQIEDNASRPRDIVTKRKRNAPPRDIVTKRKRHAPKCNCCKM